MTIVGCAIVPHGAMILPEIHKQTNDKSITLHKAMKQLSKEIASTVPDTIIVSTPHGISLQRSYGVYLNSRAAGSAEWLNKYKEFQVDVPIDLSTAKKFLDINYFEPITSFSEYLAVPLRWGEVVPMYFLDMIVDYVFISQPTRRLTQSVEMIPELLKIGKELYQYLSSSQKRYYVLISGDLAHTFSKDGPFGFSSTAETYDLYISEWIKQKEQSLLLEKAAAIVNDAKSCGFTGFVLLQGLLNSTDSNFKSKLYCIEHPTYYGMAVASYKF